MSLMILLSSAYHSSTAQQIVFPDSIVMLKDGKTGQIGYVFPHKIAIDYYNLVTYLVPALEEKSGLQDNEILKQRQIITEKDNQIGLLGKNIEDERLKFAKSDSLCKKYEKELKWKKFWKTSAMVLAGTTAVFFITTMVK